MNSNLFNLEYLQQLTIERSKVWANLMERVVNEETMVEIELDLLEEAYGPEFNENDSNDELASMEDGACDDVIVDSEILGNLANSKQLSLFNNKALSVSGKLKNEENAQLIDICDQTMPIINEHNRQLKESGLEKVLSTFDTKKIDDKVDWLNRNKERDESQKMVNEGQYKEINFDSDDFLQSGEFGRYVRSRRAGAIKNSASTTTMIKTYRMVKSTREDLHEKYVCKKEGGDYHHNTIRHRRRIVDDVEYHHNHDLTRLQRSRKHEQKRKVLRKQNRKVLRKRTYRNSCSTTSSCDSDYDYDSEGSYHRRSLTPCCSQHLSVKYKKYPSQSALTKPNQALRSQQGCVIKMPLGRLYYDSHSKTQPTLSTSSSSTSIRVFKRRRAVKRRYKLCNDNRPCNRESECLCCNKGKLCDKYKHVADNSTTDDVENCNKCDYLSDECTPITSTSNIKQHLSLAPIKKKVNTLQHSSSSNSILNHHTMTQKGILIYTPENRSRAPANSFTSDGYFTITKEHLSSVIGEKPAEKFLKYYIGRKRFNSSSTVYYLPPTMEIGNGFNVTSSSDSDDALENLGQYGDLYESVYKPIEIT